MEQISLESTVVEVFRQVLGDPKLGAEDDFFLAGGDSLLAVDAVNKLSAAAGHSVDPMLIFMYPNASACAVAITELGPR